MPTTKELFYEKRGQTLVKALKARHFDAWYCANAEAARKLALSLMEEGATISWGGSESIQEIGLIPAVKSGPYTVWDRADAATPEEREAVMHRALTADWYLTSANAISEDGELVNVDGNGNRVAAMIFGPKNILVVAGMNKVVRSQADAVTRARTIAAPYNMQRFQKNTPCNVTGCCADCKSPDCICNQILITRGTRVPGRVKIILVGEDLGF